MGKLFKINNFVFFSIVHLLMFGSLCAQNQDQPPSDFKDIQICGVFETDSLYIVKKEQSNCCFRCNVIPRKTVCVKLFLCDSVNRKSLKNIKQYNNKGKARKNIIIFSNSCIYMLYVTDNHNVPYFLKEQDSIIGKMLRENAWCFKHCSPKQVIPDQEIKWNNGHFRGVEYSILENTHHFLLTQMSLYTFKVTHPYYCSRKEEGYLESIHPCDKNKIILLAFPLHEEVYNKYKELLDSHITKANEP